jgi:hypothetical protein
MREKRTMSTLKRLLILGLIITVPAILSLKVWQVRRYQSLLNEIGDLEDAQRDWLERNKKLLTGIAVFRSPLRIEELARERLELTKEGKEPELRIEFVEQGD